MLKKLILFKSILKTSQMDLSQLTQSLNQIEDNEFGLNRILINLILQIFIKNNITDADDIITSISEYLEIDCHSLLIHSIAGKLNIMWSNSKWVWIE